MTDKQVNSGAAEQAEAHQTPSQSAKLRDGNEGQNQSANNEKIPGRPNGRTTEMKESEQSSLDLTTGMFITEEKRNSTNRMLRREEFPHVLLPPSASRRRPCCRLGRPSDLPVGLISRANAPPLLGTRALAATFGSRSTSSRIGAGHQTRASGCIGPIWRVLAARCERKPYALSPRFHRTPLRFSWLAIT